MLALVGLVGGIVVTATPTASNPCERPPAAPLVQSGVLTNSRHFNSGSLWLVSAGSGGSDCIADGPSLRCRFSDPRLVRLNLGGRDIFFAAPPGKAMTLVVEKGEIRCEVGP
jgi:hypothetical protein